MGGRLTFGQETQTIISGIGAILARDSRVIRPYNLPTEYIRAQSATDYVTWGVATMNRVSSRSIADKWAPHQDEEHYCSTVTQM